MSEVEELLGDASPRVCISQNLKSPSAWRIALYPLFTQGIQRVIFDLGEERILGRNSGMNLHHTGEKVFSNGTLSRKHAKLYVKNDKIFIEDLNSCNGTFVNGVALRHPYNESSLKTGDVLQLGCEADIKNLAFSLESIPADWTCARFVVAVFNDDFGEVDHKLAMSFYSEIISPTRETISSRGILLYPPLSRMLKYFESTALPLMNALRDIISKDIEICSLLIKYSKSLKYSKMEVVSRADSQRILMEALVESKSAFCKKECISNIEGVKVGARDSTLDRIKKKLHSDVLVPLLHPTVIVLV